MANLNHADGKVLSVCICYGHNDRAFDICPKILRDQIHERYQLLAVTWLKYFSNLRFFSQVEIPESNISRDKTDINTYNMSGKLARNTPFKSQ